MIDDKAKFEIEYELDRFVMDIRMMILQTERLFTEPPGINKMTVTEMFQRFYPGGTTSMEPA